MKKYLLCTDLDRTLIPNGKQPPSQDALETFGRLVSRQEVCLAFVTGRHRTLIEQAIAEYGLPRPDFAIADVGTTIYRVDAREWTKLEQWDREIASDWREFTHDSLCQLLEVFPSLRPQEPEKQNCHKLSFYVSLKCDEQELINRIRQRLVDVGVKANLIWSIDEPAGIGLLDVLPESANKLHAIRFLMREHGYQKENTLFAGDSGNDLDVLLSDIPAVLVANADAATKSVAAKADPKSLYIASGTLPKMNGNYSAGILEGVAHYWPEAQLWLKQDREIEG